MQYVLSVIHPDKTAVVLDPVGHPAALVRRVAYILSTPPYTVTSEEARRFGLTLTRKPLATEWVNTETGFIFRIDGSKYPPNVCPCCKALVRPDDHEAAGQEDALCLGCFTWKRGVPQCLPENTAHPEGYVPGKEN